MRSLTVAVSTFSILLLLACDGNAVEATDPVVQASESQVVQSPETTDAATQSSEIPEIQPPEMNLQVDDALPETFRGGNSAVGVVHVLEDQPYKRQENSLLYEETPQAMGASESATFDGPPTINWTTDQVGPRGSVQTIANDNSNKATNISELQDPGEYRVSNGGARQVNSTGGGAVSTATGSADQIAISDNASGTIASGEAVIATSSQRVTSTQTMGVICHDVTSPNVWAVFQEAAGDTREALDESELKQKLSEQLLAGKGLFDPAMPVAETLKRTSILAVSEFPLNKKPAEKTAAVGVKGPLFSEVGKDEVKTAGTADMKILDVETQTRLTEVVATDSLKGVFVRRNVPFIVTALATDNGDKCTSTADVNCRIEIKDGMEVEKVDGSYLFRIPNYPRAEYADQPEYLFVMEGADKDGNKTVVRLPLYVLNTQMSVEGGRNE